MFGFIQRNFIIVLANVVIAIFAVVEHWDFRLLLIIYALQNFVTFILLTIESLLYSDTFTLDRILVHGKVPQDNRQSKRDVILQYFFGDILLQIFSVFFLGLFIASDIQNHISTESILTGLLISVCGSSLNIIINHVQRIGKTTSLLTHLGSSTKNTLTLLFSMVPVIGIDFNLHPSQDVLLYASLVSFYFFSIIFDVSKKIELADPEKYGMTTDLFPEEKQQ